MALSSRVVGVCSAQNIDSTNEDLEKRLAENGIWAGEKTKAG